MTADGERPLTPEEASIEAEAVDQADRLIDYIDTMYPGLWAGAAKSARRSLRAHLYNQVTALLQRWATPHAQALQDLAREVWSVEFALNRLGRVLHQAGGEVSRPCAFCGMRLEPTPEGERPPLFQDDAGWAAEAARHRPGCAWVTSRGWPGMPGFDGGPNDPRHHWPREEGPR
jgi:hypothetical protein